MEGGWGVSDPPMKYTKIIKWTLLGDADIGQLKRVFLYLFCPKYCILKCNIVQLMYLVHLQEIEMILTCDWLESQQVMERVLMQTLLDACVETEMTGRKYQCSGNL